jgi:uncharacterized protein involved in exopolysaccharide biosynthesis
MTASERAPGTWSPPGVRVIVSIALKYKLLIIACAGLGLLAAFVTLLVLSPRYSVTAGLLFKLGREMTPPATVGATSAQVMAGRRSEDISSEIEIMRSDRLLRRIYDHFGEKFFFPDFPRDTFVRRTKAALMDVVEWAQDSVQEISADLGLGRRLSRSDRVVLALQRGLSIEPALRSDVVKITLRYGDPEQGEQVLQKFIDFYLAEHIAAYKTPQAREFFAEQRTAFARLLAEAERRRAELKRTGGVWDLLEQRRLLLSQQRELAGARAGTQAEIAQLKAEVAGLTQRLSELPMEVEVSKIAQRNPAIDILRTRLTELEVKRESLLRRYTPESRVVQDATREVDELRGTLAREETVVRYQTTSATNPTWEALKKELMNKQVVLEGLRQRETEQVRLLAALDVDLARVDSAEVELRRVEREIPLLEQTYTLYGRSLEDARISESMDLVQISNVAVIAPPSATPRPVWPPKLGILAGGLVLGLGGSVLGIAAIESLRPTVRLRHEAELVLGAPVLAMFPDIPAYRRDA